MIKKILVNILAITMVLTVTTTITACTGKGEKPESVGQSSNQSDDDSQEQSNDNSYEHEHDIVIDAAIEALCTEGGKAEGSHCSICGTVINEQTIIPALGHNIVNDECTRCGCTVSMGLEFTVIDETLKTCSITGIGSCKDTDIIIPDTSPDGYKVTSIGNCAFLRCNELTSITITGNVTNIGECAFYGCSNLTSINVNSENKIYKSESNCIIKKSDNTLIAGCNTSIIPDGVKSIGDDAFSYRSGFDSTYQ